MNAEGTAKRLLPLLECTQDELFRRLGETLRPGALGYQVAPRSALTLVPASPEQRKLDEDNGVRAYSLRLRASLNDLLRGNGMQRVLKRATGKPLAVARAIVSPHVLSRLPIESGPQAAIYATLVAREVDASAQAPPAPDHPPEYRAQECLVAARLLMQLKRYDVAIIELHYASTDPQLAEESCDLLAECYMRQRKEHKEGISTEERHMDMSHKDGSRDRPLDEGEAAEDDDLSDEYFARRVKELLPHRAHLPPPTPEEAQEAMRLTREALARAKIGQSLPTDAEVLRRSKEVVIHWLLTDENSIPPI